MNNDNVSLNEALQNQVEALNSRIEVYKLQIKTYNLQIEALKIQVADYIKQVEDYKNNCGDYIYHIEDLTKQVKDLTKQVKDLTKQNGDLIYKINYIEEQKKIHTIDEKIYNYLLEKIKSSTNLKKVQNGTIRQVIKLFRYMLEKEIISGKEIQKNFGISRNTQWRYLRHVRSLGYFKLTRPEHIPTFSITEQGKQAKEEIQNL